MELRQALLKSAAIALVAAPSAAFAQAAAVREVAPSNQSVEAVEGPPRALEEIVVTARKREETAQNVPVVVTAISSRQIERQGISSIEDVSNVVPGLSLQAPGNPTQNVLNLRGIESGNIGVGFEQSVSINIDGVQFSNGEFLRFGQFDLEHIEVLKGPQALFFGKNSPGGVISIRTAAPTQDFFAQVRGGYEFGTNKAIAETVLSGPLGHNVGARLAVSYTNSDGWWENLYPGVAASKLPKYNELLVRGTLRAAPSDRLDATLKFTAARNRGADYLYQDLVGCRSDVSSYAPYDDCRLNGRGESADPSAWAGFDPTLSPLWRKDPYTNLNAYIGSLEINYDLGDRVRLTSVSGYSELDNKRFDNIITGGAPQLLFIGDRQFQQAFSEEVRLTADLGRIRVLSGAYVDTRTVRQDSNVVLVGSVLPFFRQQIDADAWSLFAQAELDVTSKLALSVGGRYSDERKTWSGVITQANNFVVDGVRVQAGDLLRILDPKISQSNFSPEITISYKPTRDILLYGAYKEGFKSGSFGMSQTAARFWSVRSASNSFLAETADGFEAGLKSEWFDRTLRFNLMAFDYDFKNLQLSAWDPVALSTRVLNAGAANTRGVELETLYASPFVSGLTLSGNIAYLDAKYKRWISDCNRTQIDFTGAAGGCNVNVDGNAATNAGGLLTGTGFEAQDRRGDRLRAAPKWNVQVGAVYERDLTSTLRLNLNGNAQWTSSENVDILGDPRGVNDARWVVNGGVGVSAANGSWAIDLIGRNLTNERFMYYAEHAGLSGGRAFTANINPPRSVYVRLTLRPSEFGH